MGNLSNPVINRLGINTFWNTLWGVSYKYSFFFQQYKLMVYLFTIVIYYGLYNYHLFFLNHYWYARYFNNYKKKTLHHFLYYYRYQQLKNKYNNADISYLIRIKRLILYPMRLWILRYQGWVIVNWFIFQPFKMNTAALISFNQVDSFTPLLSTMIFLKRFLYLISLYYMTAKKGAFYYFF